MSDCLFIVIPAYNEQDTIQEITEEWYAVVEKIGPESRLLIIDDGSGDATYQILSEMQKQKKQLMVLTKENSGHGPTILQGYKYALEQGADYVFQTDSDGQTSASEFSVFWKNRKRYPVLIGNRLNREDGGSRKLVSFVLRLVLLLIFQVYVADANTPYRLMEAKVLKKYVDQIPDQFFLTNVLLSVLFIRNREGVKYIPISFRPRQGGTNSINIPKIIRIGLQAVMDFGKIRMSL